MKRVTLLITVLLFSGFGLAAAQDTPTPIPVVVTVILVYPSETPSPTPTDGPTPTATLTPTATPNASTTYYSGDGDVTVVREVRPADVAIVGLLVIVVGLMMAQIIFKVQEIKSSGGKPGGFE